MYIRVSRQTVELLDYDNFRSFKVVVQGTAQNLDAARQALRGIAVLDDPHTAWVAERALREWPSLRVDQAWQQQLTAMIEKARPHGWIEPSTGSIKAHIEWDVEVPEEVRDALRDALKQAMRRLASSVTIISVSEGGIPHGMTATAVTCLALDPPSLLICVNKQATIHDPLLRSGTFCVNLLRPDHQELSAAFSGRKSGADRFAVGAWSLPENEPPYLTDGQANILCEVGGIFPYGTHTIIVGRVTRVSVAEPVMPLLYQDGGYGRFAPLAATPETSNGESLS